MEPKVYPISGISETDLERGIKEGRISEAPHCFVQYAHFGYGNQIFRPERFGLHLTVFDHQQGMPRRGVVEGTANIRKLMDGFNVRRVDTFIQTSVVAYHYTKDNPELLLGLAKK